MCVWIWPTWESSRKPQRARPMLPSSPSTLLRIPCPPRMPPINEDPTVFVATWRAASRSPKTATRSRKDRITLPLAPHRAPQTSYHTPQKSRITFPLVPRRAPPKTAMRIPKSPIAFPNPALRFGIPIVSPSAPLRASHAHPACLLFDTLPLPTPNHPRTNAVPSSLYLGISH